MDKFYKLEEMLGIVRLNIRINLRITNTKNSQMSFNDLEL